MECTYGSSRHRVTATSYVRTLEQRIAELQQQLQGAAQAVTGAPLASFNDTVDIRQASSGPQRSIDLLVDAGDDLVVQQPAGIRIYRFSAALNILRTIADMLDIGLPNASASTSPGLTIVEAIDLPLQIPAGDTVDWLSVGLPPKAELYRLISYAIDRALICHRCLDQPTFARRVEELYDADRFYNISRKKSFMSLVYAVLALGERYSTEGERDISSTNETSPLPTG